MKLPPGPWQAHMHPAMNTTFTLRLGTADAARAAAVAGECFRQLDGLESLLSRYREDSDISALNRLRTGESLLLHDETWNCLRIALEAHMMTGGLFDITLGTLTMKDCPSELHGCLRLNPERPEIACVEAGRHLDLGGIGKGYALDRMADTLRDLGLSDALLSAGASTHLAIGQAAWPIELTAESEKLTVTLRENSLSASGTGIQGDHIIHPARGTVETVETRRAWVVATSAALSDALSTACFLADDREREEFLARIPELSAIMVETHDGKIAVK